MSYQMSGILLLLFKYPPKFRRVGGLWRERLKISITYHFTVIYIYLRNFAVCGATIF